MSERRNIYDSLGHRIDMTVLLAQTWMRLNTKPGEIPEPISHKDMQKIVEYVNNV